MNPLDWTAGPFLLLYAALAAYLLLLLRNRRFQLGSPVDGGDGNQLDLLHLAYLAGGPARASRTVLVALLEAGAARADRHGVIHFDPSTPVAPKLQPFSHVRNGWASPQAFEAEFATQWQLLGDDLARRGLAPGTAEVTRYRLQGAGLLCALLLFGICKVLVGLSRDRPVGFLILLLILTGIFGLIILAVRPSRNVAGTTALEIARERHARAARAPLPEELPLAFALSGAAVLAGRDYYWILQPDAALTGGDISGGSGGDGGGGGGCGGCSG